MIKLITLIAIIIAALFYTGIMRYDAGRISYHSNQMDATVNQLSATTNRLLATASNYLEAFNSVEFKTLADTVGKNIKPEKPPTRAAGTATAAATGSTITTNPRIDPGIVARHIHTMTNKQRTSRKLSALSRIGAIDSIAHRHSLDMSDRNYFEHVSPEGVTAWDRLERAGYDCSGFAENIFLQPAYISYSYTDKDDPSSYTYNWIKDEKTVADKIVTGWMNSPGHRKNILNPQYDRIGVGVVINADEKVYATQNFCF